MAKAPAQPKPPVVDDGWRIPDPLWLRIVELLPPRPVHRLGCHNPRVDDRKAMDAIFFVLRTGCQWNALNATGICSSSSAHRRFQEWVAAGVFHQLWQLGLTEYDGLKGLDWRWQAMDGAMTKAPLGGEKDGQEPHRPRQARRQAEPADGSRWHPRRGRRGRGQPGRLQDGSGDDRERPGRAA
jgi:transposase